jgi:hypothetical protein
VPVSVGSTAVSNTSSASHVDTVSFVASSTAAGSGEVARVARVATTSSPSDAGCGLEHVSKRIEVHEPDLARFRNRCERPRPANKSHGRLDVARLRYDKSLETLTQGTTLNSRQQICAFRPTALIAPRHTTAAVLRRLRLGVVRDSITCMGRTVWGIRSASPAVDVFPQRNSGHCQVQGRICSW